MGYRSLAAYAAKASNGLTTPFQLSGAPTSGVGGSFAGRAVVGSLLLDTAAGKHYIATVATGSTVTWTVVGSQV